VNYDSMIDSAARNFPPAAAFQRLFPNAEHSIVEAKRDFDPDGWKPVNEWISRAHLHDRYVVSVAEGAFCDFTNFRRLAFCGPTKFGVSRWARHAV
jgi:hypothetical protein